MTQSNLANVKQIFPNAIIKQKYGTSEFGSPASKSRGNDQLWIQLDGERFETKIIDGILFIKSQTTMLGYLDDSEPLFDTEGWYNPDTGVRGSVTPQPAYQAQSGGYCREYIETVTINGEEQKAYGTACRQPDGSWQIQ